MRTPTPDDTADPDAGATPPRATAPRATTSDPSTTPRPTPRDFGRRHHLMTGTTTADEKLTWLIQGLLERTPGARHALVLSRDGLKLCRTAGLSDDQADQLAAIAA